MNNLLSRLLQKRAVEKLDDLDKEEKQTFDEWQAVLNKEELSTEDIRAFCRTQIEVIEGKWRDLNLGQSKKSELIPYHTTYKTLLSAIESPKAAREALEKNLIQLLQT